MQIKRVLERKNSSFVALLSENYSLFGILIGALLVSASIGPFYNIDTRLEFEAAIGVIKWGRPYIEYGHVINQPPLAFYFAAPFLKAFGTLYDVGATLVTLIGLGCTILVYTLGKILYGKSTAILAAALFALTPWHLALSRCFQIDAQCLFFSLLCMLVGIYAIRKDSFKLFMVSGTLFAIAFLTKFFAVYILVPLTFFYFYYRQSKLKRISAVVAYFLPLLLLAVLWYEIITGRGLISTTGVDDFKTRNPAGMVPSAFFILNSLSTALGTLFMIAAFLSLIVCFARRRLFAKFLPFDLMSLATILVVGGINFFLGFGLNLSAPYNNAIKYDYQFLPFVSLLAASLVDKFLFLLNSMKSKEKPGKLLFSIAAVGLVLLGAALLVNMNFVNYYSTWDHWVFKGDPNSGYALTNLYPIGEGSFLMGIQYLGFAVGLSGLVWLGRCKLIGFARGLFKRVRCWIEIKNALSYARREAARNNPLCLQGSTESSS
ncbi:MAG: glycosyltransferase family 39 protein [Candidatus Bathyarchaeota archaeon]|nr:glycosyltransferase family 39 protein [Candidatus Bathyarchaeota archaeon]